MVKWENEKNVYILGAALGALGTTISNEIIESIRADWPSDQLGETPTLRAVKDQLKKLSTASSSSSTATTAKKSGTGTSTGVKKPRAAASAKDKGSAKGKGKGKGKKRAADDDDASDDVEGGDKEGVEDEGDEDDGEVMPVKKKQKVFAVNVKKEVEDEDDDGEI